MSGFPENMRLVLAHKQSTSARVRFLCFAHGICAFAPLPPLSSFDPLSSSDQSAPAPQVLHHPGVYLRPAEQRLGLPEGSLKQELEFAAIVQTPDEKITVNLALITTIDPPFAAAEAAGARFIAITDARKFSAVELGLLRHAYPILV